MCGSDYLVMPYTLGRCDSSKTKDITRDFTVALHALAPGELRSVAQAAKAAWLVAFWYRWLTICFVSTFAFWPVQVSKLPYSDQITKFIETAFVTACKANGRYGRWHVHHFTKQAFG